MGRRSAEEIHELALAGAAACFRDLGIAATNVDDIVRASGVARATLYRHAGGRDDLLLAVTLREIADLQAALIARLDEQRSIVDVLVEGVLHAVDLVRGSAVLSELVGNPSLLAGEVSEQALEALVDRLSEFVEPLFAEHRTSIRADLDPVVAVECLVRTITSLVTARVRAEPDAADRRRYLRRALVPVFVPDDVAESLDRARRASN